MPSGSGLGHSQRLGSLDDDVLSVHGVPPFQRSEVRLDPQQATLLVLDGLLDLGATIDKPSHRVKVKVISEKTPAGS